MMQEQQAQPQNVLDMARMRYMEGANQELIKWQLESEEIKQQIELNIKGYVWSAVDKKYVLAKQPLMNDKGCDAIMALLDSEIDKSRILSDFDEQMVYKLVKNFADNMTYILAFKADEFEVDRIMRPAIVMKLANVVLATYLRGKDSLTLDFLGNTERVVQNLNSQTPTARLFGGLFKKK